MQQSPGQPLAAQDHIAAKLRWDKVKAVKEEEITSESLGQVDLNKSPIVAATEVVANTTVTASA
jgi:hypothetical protein